MGKNKKNTPQKPPVAPSQKAETKRRQIPRLPVCLLFTLLVWAWASFYYNSVFEVSREYSFWGTDSRVLQYFLCKPYASVRYIGRALLTLYHYPLVGGALLALFLGVGSWLLGYVLRLPARWRTVQYVPALVYLAAITWQGLDIFFEAETGYILGIPFVVALALCVVAIIIRISARRPLPSLWKAPHDEDVRTNWLQLLVCLVGLTAVVGYNECKRDYVRTICRMMMCHYEQDWTGVQRIARANAEQSNRIMATYYAAALVHTDQIGSHVYDIRLEYDTLHIHGMDYHHNNGINMYLEEGNYHAGLIETCYHSCMEQMVMTGPTLRLLKLMTKCALMRDEWELARKYLRILADVPFEGDFCRKYGAMVKHVELVNADPEMAKIRLTEPIYDSFESQHQPPTFMGYNLNLIEARSLQALHNSIAVCLYTKLMPQFTARLAPLQGTTLPENFADGALLASKKYPELLQAFPALQWRSAQLDGFMKQIQPYMHDRAAYGEQLFPQQKGYYPHYYFFGNLRATKAGYTGESLMKQNAGVN